MTTNGGTKPTSVNDPLAPTEEERLKFKRRLFETADRSYLNDRLKVDIPEGWHGEWHGRDDASQFNSRLLGFENGERFLQEGNFIHNNPDGKFLGDAVFMVIPKWKYDDIQAQQRLTTERNSGVSSDAASDEYRAYAESLGLGVEVKERTTGRILDGSELSSYIKE